MVGGKPAQQRAQRRVGGCDPLLLAVAEDMPAAKATVRQAFGSLGKAHADRFDAVVEARGLLRNTAVVLSVRCVPGWAAGLVVGAAALGAATFAGLGS